jgi:AraC family transcriptional regulator
MTTATHDKSRQVWLGQTGWYQSDPCASFVSAARLPGDAPMQLLRVLKPSGDFLHRAAPDFTLSLLAKGVSSVRMNLGAGRFEARCRPGDFVLIPPGAVAEIRVDDPHELLTLTLPGAVTRSVLAEVAQTNLPDHGLIHANLNRDARIESMIGRVWAEAADGNPSGRLLAEDVAVAIMGRLASLAIRATGMSDKSLDEVPPLHGARYSRVITLIEDELDTNLSQAALAEAAGLSSWHFCRAFKAATGIPPHRFVMLRRLARVQQLFRTTKLTLAEIAAACGFSSHAHLTTVFRRELGANPSELRRMTKAGDRRSNTM